jgi:precorrin-6Y C5,15-methyltransferase (decarboxylating)
LVGIPDDQFYTFPDQPGLITKQPIRLLTLGSLQLPQEGVVWDIGAGTGSVAIEIARLSPQLQVYAVERNAAGICLIRRNRQRFGLENLPTCQIRIGWCWAVAAKGSATCCRWWKPACGLEGS